LSIVLRVSYFKFEFVSCIFLTVQMEQEQIGLTEKIFIFLYVLELENGKYYIGKSGDLTRRLSQHFLVDDHSSKWTRTHKPVKILEVEIMKTTWHEDFKTLLYMKKYGVENVRGGNYSRLDIKYKNVGKYLVLLDEKTSLLENELVWQNRKKSLREHKMRVKGEKAEEFSSIADIGEDGASFPFETTTGNENITKHSDNKFLKFTYEPVSYS
jgi:predicted GIY-YIG superfamily endonuclease